jgi:hypothetical protein
MNACACVAAVSGVWLLPTLNHPRAGLREAKRRAMPSSDQKPPGARNSYTGCTGARCNFTAAAGPRDAPSRKRPEGATMPTPDKLNEAYEAWRRANDEHVEMMRAVTSGEALDAEAMVRQVRKTDQLHAAWMDMVKRRDDPSP